MPVNWSAGPVRRLRFRTRHRDRGGVAVVVALVLGSGLLLGMAALVVDVGNMYAERAQLQSGADAAALKVAQVCAGPTGCDGSADKASEYARKNANDKLANATVCGRGGDYPDPEECEALGGLADCVRPAPDEPVEYAEVHTSTLRSDETTLLPPIFAQAVLGGFDGVNVTACARAGWGPPAKANSLAMTISACDWHQYTSSGAAFPPGEQFFPVYDEKTSATCPVTGVPGAGAGGFRWLTGADENCRIAASLGRSYAVNTGSSVPGGCDKYDVLKQLVGRPTLVPVFSSYTGSGGSAEYTVSGFTAFVVTGWHLPGSANRPSCNDGTSGCVYGYFTQAVLPGSGAIGGTDLGAQIISLIG